MATQLALGKVVAQRAPAGYSGMQTCAVGHGFWAQHGLISAAVKAFGRDKGVGLPLCLAAVPLYCNGVRYIYVAYWQAWDKQPGFVSTTLNVQAYTLLAGVLDKKQLAHVCKCAGYTPAVAPAPAPITN